MKQENNYFLKHAPIKATRKYGRETTPLRSKQNNWTNFIKDLATEDKEKLNKTLYSEVIKREDLKLPRAETSTNTLL